MSGPSTTPAADPEGTAHAARPPPSTCYYVRARTDWRGDADDTHWYLEIIEYAASGRKSAHWVVHEPYMVDAEIWAQLAVVGGVVRVNEYHPGDFRFIEWDGYAPIVAPGGQDCDAPIALSDGGAGEQGSTRAGSRIGECGLDQSVTIELCVEPANPYPLEPLAARRRRVRRREVPLALLGPHIAHAIKHARARGLEFGEHVGQGEE